MAQINITITNGNVDLLAKSLGYLINIPNPDYPSVEGSPETIPNPETKGQFIKKYYIAQIKERIINQKRQDVIAEANIAEPDVT